MRPRPARRPRRVPCRHPDHQRDRGRPPVLQPDVGRPEEAGAPITGGERAATGGGRNPQR
ncbi:hypothetical protein [Dankookia sp. P2]|uniref:hypothetical protein n=1 Tax=Dankookia sp. P2 TaxID=3423955 RepID=UPI003D66B451